MLNSASPSDDLQLSLTSTSALNGKGLCFTEQHLLVEEGAIDLFVERPGQAGTRHFLFQVSAGEVAFGGLDLSDELHLIAVPCSSRTRLAAIDPAEFDRLFRTANPSVIGCARQWMTRCEESLHLADRFEGELCSVEDFFFYREKIGHHLSVRMQQLAAEEAILVAGKDSRDQATLRSSLSGLASIATGNDREDSLKYVIGKVAAASRIELTVDLSDLLTSSAETDHSARLAAFARQARIRVRRVRLEARWWSRGGQSLIAFRPDGTPVAVIAGTGWRSGYELWDPEGRGPRAIGEAEARQLMPFAYSMQRGMPLHSLDGHSLARFVGRTAKPFLLPVIVSGLFAGALGIVAPLATQMLFDSVIPASARNELLQVVIGLAALALGGIAFELVRGFLLLRMATLLNAELEGALWDRLLRLPASFFRLYTSADLLIRAGAVNQIRELLSGAVLNTLLSAIFSVFTVALLVHYEWRLALVAMALVLVQLSGVIFVNLRILKWRRHALEVESQQQFIALQLLQGIAKIKIAGAEALGFARWAKLFLKRRELDLKQSDLSAGLGAFTATMSVLSPAVLIWMVGSGGLAISIGEYAAFSAAYGQFMAAMLSLAGVLPTLITVLPLYERAKPLLSAVPENSGARTLPGTLNGEVEINNVVFRYTKDGPAALDGVSIRVPTGQFVAIVGASGSGKSTLVRLLLGFDEPEAGAVFLDRQDLKALDLEAVRRQMGVVLQATHPSTGTVLENILGHSAVPEGEAWEAARLVGLDQDIASMPMKMQTFIGENGGLLSGGQRQRLMLARAVLRRPKILVLDEATSALDNRTQRLVADSLANMRSTRIVIAHRLKTIEKADRIYVLEHGRVVESGTYEELCRSNGVFRSLARKQAA